MGGELAALVSVLLAADVYRYDLSLRTEGRSGTLQAGVPSTSRALELDPIASLLASIGAFQVTGSYSPRLFRYDPPVEGGFTVLHRAAVRTALSLSRKMRLTLDESLAYGDNDFSPLLALQGPLVPTDPHLPPVLILRYLQTTSSVGATYATLTGIELGATASYSVSGGADDLARSILPQQRSGEVRGRLAWEWSRIDLFTLTLSGSRSTFSNGASVWLASTGGDLRRQLAPRTEGDLYLGTSLGQSSSAGGTPTTRLEPGAAVGLSHRELLHGQEIRGSARVALNAAIDPYGGGIYERVEGTLGAEYLPLKQLTFSLRGTGAQALSGPPQLRNRIVQAEFQSLFFLGSHLGFGAGIRAAWLLTGAPAASQAGLPPVQWVGFASVTVQQQGTL